MTGSTCCRNNPNPDSSRSHPAGCSKNDIRCGIGLVNVYNVVVYREFLRINIHVLVGYIQYIPLEYIPVYYGNAYKTRYGTGTFKRKSNSYERDN